MLYTFPIYKIKKLSHVIHQHRSLQSAKVSKQAMMIRSSITERLDSVIHVVSLQNCQQNSHGQR